MRLRRSARYLSLVLAGVFLLPLVLSACQVLRPTQVRPAQATPSNAKKTVVAPDVTEIDLPATWTPTPAEEKASARPTSTRTPTATATPNIPQTVAAKATEASSVKCTKHADAWEIGVEPAWKAGWCQTINKSGKFYDYALIYPSQWQVNTFGDIFPNLFFYTGEEGVELRLYSAYRAFVRNFTGPLEDAPARAAFCDIEDKCVLAVDPNEKILEKEIRAIGGREVLVLDSFDGTRSIRRYFFYVPYRFTRPRTNRLFFFTLFTSEPVSEGGYQNLEEQIETMLVSIEPD